MSWFKEQRLLWIKESVEIFGHVNRFHIEKKFGISSAQASLDLRQAQHQWPELMDYDKSGKKYLKKTTTEAVA